MRPLRKGFMGGFAAMQKGDRAGTRVAGKTVKMSYAARWCAGFSPVRFRFVFSPSFIFNNMARFVLRFVFSTAMYFQQLPRFVFRFVPVRFSK